MGLRQPWRRVHKTVAKLHKQTKKKAKKERTMMEIRGG